MRDIFYSLMILSLFSCSKVKTERKMPPVQIKNERSEELSEFKTFWSKFQKTLQDGNKEEFLFSSADNIRKNDTLLTNQQLVNLYFNSLHAEILRNSSFQTDFQIRYVDNSYFKEHFIEKMSVWPKKYFEVDVTAPVGESVPPKIDMYSFVKVNGRFLLFEIDKVGG